jgi:methionine-rich copper-binding protein CopC
LIKIDGEWVIPDFDPETTMLTVTPRTDLKDGEHHLSIEITDRLGHKAEQYVRFNVNTQVKAGKRR